MEGGSVFDADGSLGDHYGTMQGLVQFPADQPLNIAAAAANNSGPGSTSAHPAAAAPSRYESQKRRDWNTFGQYLKNHRPPLALAKCSGAHVLEFLRYLDQFGKTKVHMAGCPYFGQPQPPAACACPLRQAWGSLDALIGRLRAAFEENGGKPESNPFGARAVRLYLREVREMQAKARGIAYEKKKRRRPPGAPPAPAGVSSPSPPSPNKITTRVPTTPSPAGLLHHHMSPDRHRPAPPIPGFPSYAGLQMFQDHGCLPPRVLPQPVSLIIPPDHSPYRPHHELSQVMDTPSPNSSDGLIPSFD